MNAYYDVSLKDYRLEMLEEIAGQTRNEGAGIEYHFVKGDIADKSLIDSLFGQYKFDVVQSCRPSWCALLHREP